MKSSYYHLSTTAGVLLAQMIIIIEDAIFNLRIISSIVRILQFLIMEWSFLSHCWNIQNFYPVATIRGL